jgi:serine/threonine protein kinase
MLIDQDGTLKLSDFGLSIKMNQSGTLAISRGNVAGTIAYMSEAVMNGKYDEGTDLWALACAVGYMATGRHPWHEAGVPEDALAAHIRQAAAKEAPHHHPVYETDW